MKKLFTLVWLILFSLNLNVYAYETPEFSKTFYGDANGDMAVQGDDLPIHKMHIFGDNVSYDVPSASYEHPNNKGATCDVDLDGVGSDLGHVRSVHNGVGQRAPALPWSRIVRDAHDAAATRGS